MNTQRLTIVAILSHLAPIFFYTGLDSELHVSYKFSHGGEKSADAD